MKRQKGISTAWKVALCAVFGAVTIAIAQNKVIPCISLLQEAFGIDMTEAGWLSSVYNVMGIAMAFPGVIIVNRWGAKKVCLISLACGILGAGVGFFARNIGLLMVGRVIEGMGAGLVSIAVPEFILQWFPPEKRGMPMGLWSSWQYIGQAVCFSVGAGISAVYGWHGVWIFGLSLSVLALILNIIFVKMPTGARIEVSRGEEKEKGQIYHVLFNKNTWKISMAIFCFCVSSFGFIAWIASCWTKTLGISELMANRYVSLFAAISIPMVLAVGWALDHVDRKGFCFATFIGYAGIVAAGFLLWRQELLLPFVVIYAFFESAVITALWTIISLTVEKTSETTTAVALLTLCSNIGMLAGPPGIGMCVQQFGWEIAAVVAGVFHCFPKCVQL